VFTIGFAETSAAEFFALLRGSEATRVLDVRLNNTSQLAGFTKKDDLRFFLREVCEMDYFHVPELAPTQELLDAFKKRKGSWETYAENFNELIAKRGIESSLTPAQVDGSCMLCSEKRPEHCHRRLVAEYLERKWSDVVVTHLT
jgi:uncharacterized protein (DUF488 family)